jgi:hypothetical protein
VQNRAQSAPKSMPETLAVVHMPYKPNPHAPAGVSPKWVDRCSAHFVSLGGSKQHGLESTYAVVPGQTVVDSSNIREGSSGAAVRITAFERGIRQLRVD